MGRRLGFALLLLFALTFVWSCSSPATERSSPQGSTTPQEVKSPGVSHYERKDNKPRVVVFIHGIFGDATDTWTCGSTGAYWPKLLLKDSAFDDSDVYVVDYDSPYLGNTMTIDEVVSSLSTRLEADRVFDHREVVFVAHSLGGLIAQRFLLTHRVLAAKVPFIYFFSTPETGAQIAALGRAFSRDPLLKAMLPGNSNDYLLNLENEWIASGFSAKRFCAYEKKTFNGVLVVDRLSGTRNCTSMTPLPINADHLSIVKPCDERADAYLALRNAVIANPVASLPKRYEEKTVTREWRSPSMNVDCNRTTAGTATAAIALDPKLEEQVLSVSASIIDANNINDPKASVLDPPSASVRVSYSFNGRDRDPIGSCPGGGHGTVLATFTVRQRMEVP
jgi:hypothetical protein